MLCSALLEILTKKYQIYMDLILAEINNLLCTVFQPTGYIFNISVLKHHSQIYGIYEKKQNLAKFIWLISTLLTDLVFEHFQFLRSGNV